MKLRSAIYFLTMALFAACDPETEVRYAPYQPKLVIDGWIEAGGYPKVMLTTSASYFGSVDSVAIRDIVVRTAKVSVSDGENEEVLTLTRDDRYFPPYVYSGTELIGETGKRYTLKVESRGEVYTSETTIPSPEQFDDLWFELEPGMDSLGYIYGKFTDDPDTANYYRVFTQRKSKDNRYIPVYLSAIGDQSFNGKSFTFSILRGPDSFANIADDLYFAKGDTVSIKFCTMDKPSFDFWRTLERELYNVGNPFSSSGNEVISNIDNRKALGVWAGYGVNYYTLIVK